MNKHMLKLCVLGVWILCVLAVASAQEEPAEKPPGKPQEKAQVVKKGDNLVEVTVTGQGMTREEAMRDAQRKAVEQGAGTFIYSHSQTKDFELVKDTILARSAGFVQSAEEVSAKQNADGVWEVKVKAVVSVKGIEDTWGVVTNLLQQIGRPKIMVALTEKIDAKAQEDSTVQTRIENLLLKSGFLLVNKDQLKEIDKKDIAAAAAEDNPAKIQAVAKRFGAQLFITGSSNAVSSGAREVYGVQLFNYGANGDIKCYRSDTAQLLASQNGTAESSDRNPGNSAKKSLSELGNSLGPKVQFDILRFWQDAVAGRGEVQLQVENIEFAESVKLKNALKEIKGVNDVTRKYSNKIAEYSVQCDVNAEQLAEKIAETFKNIEITDVTQNVIKAKAKSN